MSTGGAHNLAGVIVCRTFLGIFEAAFGAGAPFFLSMFYQRRELGKRVAILTGMSPLANCFASTLAYGILHIQNSTLETWRLLFIIGKWDGTLPPLLSTLVWADRRRSKNKTEGAPTVAFAAVVYFFLADGPGKAHFLTAEERADALARLDTVDRTTKSKISWSQVTAALTDYKNYTHTMIHFCCNYSFASLSNFLPTIVQGMGYSSLQTQGLTAPAYLAAFICCVAAAWFSDKYGRRGYVVAVFAAMGTVGYLLLTVIQDEALVKVRYAAIYLACCGIFPALSINMTMLLNNQGGDTKKGVGLALLATFGQCSSFISSALFPSSDR